MNTLEKIKKNEIIKMLYEAPYRVYRYSLAKRIYKRQLASMTDTDIKRIKEYRDIHKGERCFIVLTGPSLSSDDLGMIKNEVSFTVNSGYKAYGINGWTPKYYVSMDGNEVAQEMLAEVLSGEYSYTGFFTDVNNTINSERLTKLPTDVSHIFRINSILNRFFNTWWTTGAFSNDISKVVYTGKTVLCSVLQIAYYMGFDEIYLIGADFNYSGELTHSRLTEEENRSTDWDARKTEREMMIQMNDFAREVKKKGIKVFNATRGGELECFERRQLEEVVGRKDD